MAKRLFPLVVFLSWINPVFLHADVATTQPAPNPAFQLYELAKVHHVPWPYNLVVFSYQEEGGKWVNHETTYKNLPPELQDRNWECWVDFNEVHNCKEVK